MRPIGGHHFIEDGINMKGDTLEAVVRKITDYRINNSRPLGDPKQEVLQYYAINWPYMVEEDEIPSKPRIKNHLDTWMSWIRSQWAFPPQRIVTSKEAEPRWAICLKCPHNITLQPETEEHRECMRKSFLLKRGVDTPKKLGFCSLHLFDISVASFLEAPAKVSGIGKDTAQPPSCWVSSSLTEHR